MCLKGIDGRCRGERSGGHTRGNWWSDLTGVRAKGQILFENGISPPTMVKQNKSGEGAIHFTD